MRCQLLQSLGFVLVDVASLVFRKAEDKHPTVPLVGGDQCWIAAALALSRPSNPLFDQAATEVGIHKALHHFVHRSAEAGRGQSFFARPAVEPPRFVDVHAHPLNGGLYSTWCYEWSPGGSHLPRPVVLCLTERSRPPGRGACRVWRSPHCPPPRPSPA